MKTSITDIDTQETLPAISIQDISVTEGATAVFTISLSKPAPTTAVISYSMTDETAAWPSDYAGMFGFLTVTPGSRTIDLLIPTVDDSKYEGNETFRIELSSATNAIMSSAIMHKQVTIVDNEVKPHLFISDASVGEGGTLVFGVSLDVPSQAEVSFDYLSSDGTASVAAGDYSAVAGRFTLASTVMSGFLSVVTNQDVLDEVDETLNVVLSSLSGADAGDVAAVGTIVDDDSAPVLSVADLSVNEGLTAQLAVSLSAVSGQDVYFDLATADGLVPGFIAVNGVDYSGVTLAAAKIPAGSTVYYVNLVSLQDSVDENDEVFKATVSNVVNASTGTLVSNVTILDDDATPQLFISDASVSEGGSLAFVVSVSGLSGFAVTYDFASSDLLATVADLDYTAASGSVTLAAGQWSQVLYVPTTADTKFEVDETLNVSLSNVVNVGVGRDLAVGTIVNDDTVPALSVADLSFNEGTTGVFIATLSAVSGVDVVFTWATANGSNADPLLNAVAPSDYTAVSATVVTIPVGSLGAALSVESVQDSIDERDEGFKLNVSAVSGASPGSLSANGTILDDDASPQLFVDDINVGEGLTGFFTVTLSAPTGLDVVFDWATFDGVATAANDYNAVTLNSVTIPTGSLTAILPVSAKQDLINEGSEDFVVSLSSPVEASVADGTGVATIVDDDGPPQILISDAIIGEGGTLEFVVTLTATSGLPISFDFASSDDVATVAESDYVAKSGRGTIAAGALSYSIFVVTSQDALDEYDETLFVDLANETNGVILDGHGVGTITDDDNLPNLFVSDASVTEGGSLVFKVTIDQVSGRDVTFDRATSDGSGFGGAVSPADFASLALSGLTIAKGVTSVTVQVATIDDVLYEPTETMQLDVSSVVNAVVVDAQGVGTINDNDTAPKLYVGDVAVTEGATAQFLVTLDAISGIDVVFDAATSDNTASAPLDYAAVSLSNITIPAGSLSYTISVVTNDDVISESTEDYHVDLTIGSGALAGDLSAVGTINDNDLPPQLYVSDAAVVTEGQTAYFTISLNAVTGLAVTFNYQTLDDTAVSTQDYTGIASTVGTIPAGSLTFLVPVATTDDVVDEVNSEYFTVTLTGSTNAGITVSSGQGTITDNDNPPQIFIVDSSVLEGGTMVFAVSISAASDLNDGLAERPKIQR